jgi:hypothetical protein
MSGMISMSFGQLNFYQNTSVMPTHQKPVQSKILKGKVYAKNWSAKKHT